MNSLVKPHKQSFLRKQESRKTKENTGFPLKDCGNDGKTNVLLLMVFLLFTCINMKLKGFFIYLICREENNSLLP